jgi:3-oxoacyl-[acyl-carrier-protein] synthase II
MKKRVVVTGVGAVTPVGNTAEEFWQSIVAGKNGVGLIKQMNTDEYSSKIGAEVKDFDPTKYMPAKEARRNDVFVHFAVASSKMAFDDCKLSDEHFDPFRCGVILGSGIGGLRVTQKQHQVLVEKGPTRISPFMIPMLICNIASGIVAINHDFKGPNSCTVTACASGTHSLGDAFKIIQRGDADIMLAGGSESCITELGLGGFCSMKALSTRNDDPAHASRPFERDRDGFVMGEGAGMMILEELQHALNRGARIYCEMVGYGMSCDAYHITAPDPSAKSAARCIQNAINDAGLKAKDIAYINAHGTSTQLNDVTETRAIKLAFGDDAKGVKISSTKSMTGHLLGAAGGVEAIAAALAVQNDLIPPTINYDNPDPECDLDYTPNEACSMTVNAALSNSLGFGGHNATIVFKKYNG